jgi:hypothetical protein
MRGDPVEHQFPWYWYDAGPLTGLDPDAVLEAGAPHLSRLPARLLPTMTEVWAAGYLLGADVGALLPALADCGPLTSAALRSWIDQGLAEEDRRLGETLRSDCVRLAMTAVREGLRNRRCVNAG